MAGWSLCFLGLLVLNLVPIWAFPYFPSQDGPAHLDSAVALKALASGDTFFREYYQADWRFATNQVYLWLLVGLGSFVPLIVAEKILLSVYVVMLPAAMLFAIGQLRTAELRAVLLVFPLIYTYVLQMGFYNYCLGLAFFLFAIGLYLKFTRAPTFKNALILSFGLFVTYIIHLVVAASAMLAIGSMAAGRLLRPVAAAPLEPGVTSSGWFESNRKEFGLLALAVAPVILVVIVFLSTTDTSAFKARTSLLASVTQAPLKLAVHPRLSQTFTLFSLNDLVISGPWNLLLFSLAGLALLKARGLHDGRQYGFLGYGVAVFLVLILVIPDRMVSIHSLYERCLPFFYFLLILWLSTKPLTPLVWRRAAGLAIALSAASVVYRLPIYADLDRDLEEFASAADYIQDNSTVLPVNLDKNLFSGLVEKYPRARFDHTRHAGGYIALSRRIINLGNYQASLGYFPIRFRDQANSHLDRPWGDSGEFEVDFDAYKAATGRHIDYVLLWGNIDEVGNRKRVSSFLRKISPKYSLVYVSRPRGLMRVYRAN